jgi:hypothetical protein
MDTSGFDEAVLREYATRLVDIVLYRYCVSQQDNVYIDGLYGYYLLDAQEDLYYEFDSAIFQGNFYSD